ncbi:MAG: ribonuclease H-like domain-containing protein [Anaerovoracaceae bacterium]
MKTIEKRYKITEFNNKTFSFYFNNLNVGVFDIETTGLNPTYCNLILSGIIGINNNVATVTQYFAENQDQETEVISATIKKLSEFDIIITYNGKHFDLPFLEKRANTLGIAMDFLPYNLDIYLVLHGHSYFRQQISNLKQKTVEIFMGIASGRDDEISGAESVELYNEYTRTSNPLLLEKILLHNCDDVIQLYRLLSVIPKTDFHHAMFKLGFPINSIAGNSPILTVDKITLEHKHLRIMGSQKNKQMDYINFPTESLPIHIIFDSASRSFELIIPLIREQNAAYIDLLQLGVDSKEFSKYPSFENGYLILENNKVVNHLEINHLSKVLLNKILSSIF